MDQFTYATERKQRLRTMPLTLASVIEIARTESAVSAAEFDYGIANQLEPDGLTQPVDNAMYELANRDMPIVVPGIGKAALDELEARHTALRTQLAADLAGFAARCRARRYVGWSNASAGPIEYGDGGTAPTV